MINSTSLGSDKDILPSLSPSSRKDVGDCGMAYNGNRAEIIDFGLTGVLSEDGVVLIHIRVFEKGLGLLAVNHGKSGINTLSYSVRSRPFIPETKGWEKQQDSQKSHGTHVVVQLPE
jgi:hypothetical protein